MRHKVLLLLEKASQYSTEYIGAQILRVYEEQEFDRAEEDLQMISLTNPQSLVLLVDPQFASKPPLNFSIDSSAYQGVKIAQLGDTMICAREESPIL